MNRKFVVPSLISIAILAIVIYLAATKQGVQQPPARGTTSAQKHDPLGIPLIAHMQEAESITIAASPTADLAVYTEDSNIRVVLSDKLLGKLGPGALDILTMTGKEETMTWDRYNRFIAALHDQLVARNPNSHDHEQEHHHE